MTTNPKPSIHGAAASGFSAGAAIYASGRPDYPAEIVGWLRERLELGPQSVAVDLGAGTGKFLPALIATGAKVIAVEPVDAMRDPLSAAFPNVAALRGTAEALPAAAESLDAIVCAQSFHWFATPAALSEILRALKRGGWLGLVWNVRDESRSWVAELARMIAPYEGDAPRFGSGRWRELFPAAGFSPLEETRIPHAHFGPPEQVIVQRTLSTSFVAALGEQQRTKIAAEIRSLVAASPELSGAATVSYPYLTCAFACRKL